MKTWSKSENQHQNMFLTLSNLQRKKKRLITVSTTFKLFIGTAYTLLPNYVSCQRMLEAVKNLRKYVIII